MKQEALESLVCPRREGARPCHGTLQVEQAISNWDEDPQESLEAILRCEGCKRTYPVVCGIPILMDELPQYLRDNYYFMVGCCQAQDSLSDEMQTALLNYVLLDLKTGEEEIFPTARRYTREAQLGFLTEIGPYLCNHYDDLGSVVRASDPFYEFLKSYSTRNPHAVLEGFATQYSYGGRGLSLDIGCHVGGFTALQAQRSRLVYGVDVSFEKLLLASRILKGRPKGLDRYRLYQEGKRYHWRKLHAPRCQNIEFVVATGDNLPFKASSVDTVSSCNVVDIVAQPMKLVDEKVRVLKKGGLLLLSDPYEFYGARFKKLETRSRKSPLSIIKQRMASQIRIVQEEDDVPWITHKYNRSYMIYYNHCLAGIKGKSKVLQEERSNHAQA
ncbi:MAG: methyltransferase domain-containing protein [Candidatus Binatia bacterium]